MSKLLASVDLKTQLAGTNRLELLMFTLDSNQTYAINVFKVQEVIRCPNLTQVPHAHSVVRGIANLRGRTIPVIDLAMAIGKRPLENPQDHTVIVSEYNRSIQGFLVGGMDRIVNMNWEQILPPPSGLSSNAYLTAVTEVDGRLVQIVDVEKVLVEVMPRDDNVSDELLADVDRDQTEGLHVLVADDSFVARLQGVQRALNESQHDYDLVFYHVIDIVTGHFKRNRRPKSRCCQRQTPPTNRHSSRRASPCQR